MATTHARIITRDLSKSPAAKARDRRAPARGARPPGSRRTILIIDDDATTRESLADLLEALGYRVSCAADGVEALAYLRENPAPGLILVDLMMPKMNGWVFGLERRRQPQLADVPVIVLSGIYDAESAAGYISAQGYLEKPIDPIALFNLVRRHCR
jgi:CheY-like chemotaxis protein